eukprot:3397151-Pleurochrysis_carterae.AAC.1
MDRASGISTSYLPHVRQFQYTRLENNVRQAVAATQVGTQRLPVTPIPRDQANTGNVDGKHRCREQIKIILGIVYELELLAAAHLLVD